jgi:MraZ protein
MASFKGTYTSTIDPKRRLKLPKKLKDAIPPSSNESFVIAAGYDECIFIYPKEEWEKQEQKLRDLMVDDLEEHRFYEREFFPKSEDVKIDRAGRLTLPQGLLDHAQIKPKEEIFIFGVLSRIELWNPEVYQKYKERFPQTREQVAQKIFKPPNVVDKK